MAHKGTKDCDFLKQTYSTKGLFAVRTDEQKTDYSKKGTGVPACPADKTLPAVKPRS